MKVVLTELASNAQLGYGVHALMHQCNVHDFDVEYVPYSELRASMRPDVWLVSAHHALQYYNVATFFKKTGVEPLRTRRKGKPLLICGGGSVSSNPLPLSDFFDLFCIGDGEEWLVETLGQLEQGTSVTETAEIVEGSWLPDWETRRIVHRRVFDGICNTPISLQFPGRGRRIRNVIYMETARGCRHRCQFCKLGWTQPYREISFECCQRKLADAIFEVPQYHQLALMAPDVCGISWIRRLPVEMGALGMSMPYLSSRFDSGLVDFGKGSMYRFGLEGMSEFLRRLVGKFISDDAVRKIMQELYNEIGCPLAKWFIITGLPGECDDDYTALGELFRSLASIHPTWGILRVSATQFVPEPYTPMQWFSVHYDSEVLEKLEDARQMIRSIPRRKRTFGVRPIERPLSQARHILNVLATRGDSRMGGFLLGYAERGLRYRKTTELLDPITTLAAKAGFTIDWLIGSFEPGDVLPWGQFIDCGVSSKTLAKGYERIKQVLHERTIVPSRPQSEPCLSHR